MSKFQEIDFYRSPNPTYSLLPFRFTELDSEKYVLSNFAGEYLVAEKNLLPDLIKHRLGPDHPMYSELRARHFLVDDVTSIAPELLAIKLRTKYEHLAEFTALHMFVVSLRCEHSCPYCQVSRQSEDKQRFDMSPETARRALDLAFRSPSQMLKIEFQGGEPLLNFDLIREIVIEAERRNEHHRKD